MNATRFDSATELALSGTSRVLEKDDVVITYDDGIVKMLGDLEFLSKIRLILPIGLFADHENCPYGEFLTTKIARAICGDLAGCSFGIVPGDYSFEEDRSFRFNGGSHRLSDNACSIMFYADTRKVVSYAYRYGLTSVRFGKDGLYGVFLPLSFLVREGRVFSGSSEEAIFKRLTIA